MKNEPFVSNGDMYRLRSDWPWPFANTKPEGLPKEGELIFYRESKRNAFGHDRVMSRISDGYSCELKDLDVDPYPTLSYKDFPQLLRYYLKGWAVLPNFQFRDPQSGLDCIAAGGGMNSGEFSGVQFCLIPGTHRTPGRGLHPIWTRVFLQRTQGGQIEGSGFLIWYKGAFEKNNPNSQVASFALCRHTKHETSSYEARMRGWHPGSCTRCGLNMTYDSSD